MPGFSMVVGQNGEIYDAQESVVTRDPATGEDITMPASQAPEEKFDLGGFMKSEGMSYVGQSDLDLPIYRDKEGTEHEVHPGEFLPSLGIPTSAKLTYNTPDAPSQDIPEILKKVAAENELMYDSMGAMGMISKALDKTGISSRAALGVGNVPGGTMYLKGLGAEDVKYDAKKGFTVLENGVWKAVDPEGLGQGSPLEKTQELIRDIADNPGLLINGALQGTAAAVTGGMSLAGQVGAAGVIGGISETIRSSLGRAVGTYAATPEQQLSDLGHEVVLNAAGTGFVLGGLKGAKSQPVQYLLEKAGSVWKGAAEGSKQAAAGLWSLMTRKPAQDFMKYANQPDEVVGALKNAMAVKGRFNVAAIKDYLAGQNVEQIKNLAKSGREVLSSVWKSGSDDIARIAEDGFEASGDEAILPLTRALKNNGLGVFVDPLKPGAPVTEEVLESFISKHGRLPSRFQFVPHSEDQLISTLKKGQGTELSDFLASNDEARAMMVKFMGKLNKLHGGELQTGKAGLNQLLRRTQTLKDEMWTISQEAQEAGFNQVSNTMAELAGNLSNGVSKTLSRHNPEMATKYAELATKYSNALRDTSPVLRAAKQAAKVGNDTPFQTLLSQITSVGGKNSVQKEAIPTLMEISAEAATKGGARAKALNAQLLSIKNSIEVNNAATSFSDMTSGFGSAIGVGGGFTALSNPAVGLPMMATAAATSPRFTLASMQAARTAAKPFKTAIEAGFQAKELLTSMNPKQLEALRQNPDAFRSFATAVVGVPFLEKMTEQQLTSQVQQRQQQ